MSGYDEIWYELHAKQIQDERDAMRCRNELNNLLTMEEKVDIIFALQIEKLTDNRVINIYKDKLKGRPNEE